MHQPMQGAGAQVEKKESSWILSRDRMQSIITALDLNTMTLKAAKLYYSAYGVVIKGRTKEQFIRNLSKVVEEANQ